MSTRHRTDEYPEVLPPRSNRARRVFNDENLGILTRVLDDWLRIPGTSIRFGVDAVIGLVPGIGDVLGGLASCTLLLAAWSRGVPYITLVRMTVNVGIDVLVGAVPLMGDAFDLAWKANRRNYKLLVRHVAQPRRHTWKDWVFLWALGAAVLAVLALPSLVLVWVVIWLLHYRAGI